MLDEQTIFIACIVLAVALGGFFLSRVLFGKGDGKLRQRLSNRQSDVQAVKAESGAGRAKDLFQKIGTAAAKPFMPDTREKMSALRKKLSAAGIYSPAAIRTVTGMKVICLAVGVISGYLIGVMFDNLMLGLSLGGLVGYMGPSMWLKMQIKKQQKAIDYALPDALDLMVVCIEAGLAVDAAMQRVGSELAIAHPRLFKDALAEPHSLNAYFDRAIAAGRLFGMPMHGHWITVGTPDAIPQAEAAVAGALTESQ